MAERAENEGFRMLDDFVCEAIQDPAVAQATPSRQGQNEGMNVIAEFVLDRDGEIPKGSDPLSQQTGP